MLNLPQAFYEPGPNGGIKRLRRAAVFTAPTAHYPFACSRHQGGIEAIFADAMKAKGLEIDRPTVPISLQLSEDKKLFDTREYPVKITLRTIDENEVVHAKFVVGADGKLYLRRWSLTLIRIPGAHSWVRKTIGIDMKGDQSDYIWGVIDFRPSTDFPDVRNLSIIHSHDGSALLIPRENDHIRVYVQLSKEDVVDPDTGRVDKQRTSPEILMKVANSVLKPYTIAAVGEIEWWTVYVGEHPSD
ncbi:FAD-linked reductase [Trametes cingulata]|nr:FAD-linked reductase [Trametes cingulata]